MVAGSRSGSVPLPHGSGSRRLKKQTDPTTILDFLNLQKHQQFLDLFLYILVIYIKACGHQMDFIYFDLTKMDRSRPK
jgi:hypothetical protein